MLDSWFGHSVYIGKGTLPLQTQAEFPQGFSPYLGARTPKQPGRKKKKHSFSFRPNHFAGSLGYRLVGRHSAVCVFAAAVAVALPIPRQVRVPNSTTRLDQVSTHDCELDDAAVASCHCPTAVCPVTSIRVKSARAVLVASQTRTTFPLDLPFAIFMYRQIFGFGPLSIHWGVASRKASLSG